MVYSRVLLELRSWQCPRQAHESPCSKSTTSRDQAKQGIWETLGRDQGWRETVMFYLGLVVTTFSRVRF